MYDVWEITFYERNHSKESHQKEKQCWTFNPMLTRSQC